MSARFDNVIVSGARVAVRSSTECEMPSWFGFVDMVSGRDVDRVAGSREHRGPGMALAFDR